MFSLNLENDALQKNDLSILYEFLRKLASLSDDELNIEGAICVNKTMLLFQRGNGKNSKNGIFIIPDNASLSKHFVAVKLPKIKNIEVSFS